ncbi:MAG TPA: M15 family metallopeptidase [Candidatus Cloacimonadota bacterium]|nr:M15 family metallopeptidase [Candidatus Cloacimonadota bacterium]HPS39370.1 M15 family metallopeptidase [Candidatus Cloacimonadota bacterium]
MPHRSKEQNYSRFIILGFILLIVVLALLLGMKLCHKDKPQSPVVKMVSQEAVVRDSIAYPLNYLLGKTSKEFIQVTDSRYAKLNLSLRPETYKAFKMMYDAADSAGVSLKLLSGTRSWEKQRSIWENELTNLKYSASKPKAEKIKLIKDALEYISLPGSSRHHWGTEIDIFSLNVSDWNKGDGKKAGDWLEKNAAKYGFYQAYTDPTIDGRKGFSYEPWHWSYKPLSQKMYQDLIAQVSYQDFKGFTGAELCQDIDLINVYIKGINPALK